MMREREKREREIWRLIVLFDSLLLTFSSTFQEKSRSVVVILFLSVALRKGEGEELKKETRNENLEQSLQHDFFATNT